MPNMLMMLFETKTDTKLDTRSAKCSRRTNTEIDFKMFPAEDAKYFAEVEW